MGAVAVVELGFVADRFLSLEQNLREVDDATIPQAKILELSYPSTWFSDMMPELAIQWLGGVYSVDLESCSKRRQFNQLR